MSTLGGSKGERHAKPKFQTIDINTLHRSSRGETLEPSTQKNQPPRKYGMQILGKVPSARRPPANLPSLKAETLTPTDQQGSWGGGTQEGAQSATGTTAASVESTSTLNTSTSSTISNISSTIVDASAPTVTTPSTNNNKSSTTSIVANQQQLQSNFNSTHSAAASSSLPSNNNNNNNIHNTSNSSHTSNNSGSGSSTTWSSVTTGNLQNEQSGQPPLYQSPQFQHEFPSLDGSTVSGSKGHSSHHQQHAGSTQGGGGGQNLSHQEMSLRPQTNVGSWMQQQQQQQQNQGGNGNRGDMINGPNSQQDQALQNQVPHPVRSLMPSFMVRGGGGGVGGAGIQGSGGGFQQGSGGTIQSNYSQTQARPRSQPGAQSQPMYDQQSNYYGGGGGSGGGGSGIGQNSQPQRRPQGPMQKRPPSDERQSVPFIDPDMVSAHQRPIIKEEELKRMDYIAKDTEGWANQDDIDYNQKLHFSDDETVDGPPERTASTQKNDKKHNESHAQAQVRQQQQQQLQQQEEEKRVGECKLFYLIFTFSNLTILVYYPFLFFIRYFSKILIYKVIKSIFVLRLSQASVKICV